MKRQRQRQEGCCQEPRKAKGHQQTQNRGEEPGADPTPIPQSPQKEPALPIPWFWTSGPLNWQGIRFCCLNHPVCGTLLQRPHETHTAPNPNSCQLSKELIGDGVQESQVSCELQNYTTGNPDTENHSKRLIFQDSTLVIYYLTLEKS